MDNNNKTFLTLKQAWERLIFLVELGVQYEKAEFIVMKEFELDYNFIVHFELKWKLYKQEKENGSGQN